jgi:hypothetical protein
MKIHTQPIPLTRAAPAERLVKRCALLAFRALRTSAGHARKIPDALVQATADVRDAWQASSCPKS